MMDFGIGDWECMPLSLRSLGVSPSSLIMAVSLSWDEDVGL
jgi:hypothetical protein